MGRPATLRVQITGDATSAQRALDRTGDAATRTSSKWKSAGRVMASAFAAAAIGAVVKDSIAAASDLQQAMGGVEAVFGDSADTVKRFADTAAEAAGLSKAQYASLATVIGSQMKNAGASVTEAAGRSQELIARGADMAALFGGTAKEAVEAMSSALKGEMDPIERYGVTLNQAAIKAQMAADGTDKLTGAAAAQAKQAAIINLIMKQSADSAGRFAEESDSLAGQTERMNANWANAKATLGTALLPILTKLAGVLSKVASFVQQNTGWLIPLAAAVLGLVVAYKAYTAVMALSTAATAVFGRTGAIASAMTKVWAGIQLVFNAIMAANPIVLIILAIIALIAVIALLWTKNEAFRNAVIGIWQAISRVVMTVVRAIVNFVVAAWKFMLLAVSTYIQLVRTVLTTVWRAIVAVITTYVNLVRAVITAVFNAIVRIVTVVWSAVRTVSVAGWNNIKNAVAAVVNALKTSVTSIVNGIKTTVLAVWEALRTSSGGVWNALKTAIETPLNAIKRAVDSVWGKIKDFIDFITNLKFPKIDFPDIPGFGKSAAAVAGPAVTAAGTRAPTVSTVAAAAAPLVIVHVQIGERTVTDMVTDVVATTSTALARRLTSRTGVLR
jgi:hypothetical protein